MSTADLPALNAVLNGSAAVLLVLAWLKILGGNREAHRKLMLAAVVLSGLFLLSYLTYHALHGSRRFEGPPGVRRVYLGILLTHTVLAAVNLPLVIVTLWRALKGRFAEHRRIARWTFGIWLYVSVTGVVIYLMLYQLYPPVH